MHRPCGIHGTSYTRHFLHLRGHLCFPEPHLPLPSWISSEARAGSGSAASSPSQEDRIREAPPCLVMRGACALLTGLLGLAAAPPTHIPGSGKHLASGPHRVPLFPRQTPTTAAVSFYRDEGHLKHSCSFLSITNGEPICGAPLYEACSHRRDPPPWPLGARRGSPLG